MTAKTFDWDAAFARAEALIEADNDLARLSAEERENIRNLLASRACCVHGLAYGLAPERKLYREIVEYEEELVRYGLV